MKIYVSDLICCFYCFTSSAERNPLPNNMKDNTDNIIKTPGIIAKYALSIII